MGGSEDEQMYDILGAMTKRNIRIIGLIGHIGAGKTSIATYLESKGCLRITLSDFLKEEATVRGLAPTRRNLQDLGDEFRRRHGGSFLAARAVQKALNAGSVQVVVDGLRNPDEVRALKDSGNALLLAVCRPYSSAPRFEQSAITREMSPSAPPWGQRVADSTSMADVVIVNSGDLEDLYARVDSLLLTEVPS